MVMCNSPNNERLANQSYSNHPYIISPRRTYVLDKNLTIHWNEVPGATSYVVSIINDSKIHWQKRVVGTKLVYPGEPLLNPGVLYLIKIESDNNFSSESVSDDPRWGFRVLEEKLIPNLQTAVADIKQKSADKASDLKLVSLYIGYGLFAKAIETLEQLTNAKSQDAEVYYTLGELYSHVGLHSHAKKSLEKALKLLKNPCDVKEKIVVKVELAQVKAALGAKDESSSLLQEAQSEFKALTDDKQRKEVEEIIAGLISKNGQPTSLTRLAGCQNNCVPSIPNVPGEKKGYKQICFPCDPL